MSDVQHVGQGDPQNRLFKQIGTTPEGQPILAEYVALEPGSIGGGGGGVAASVTVADGTVSTQKAAVDASGRVKVDGSSVTQPASVADGSDVAQGTTTDLSSASTVIGLLKAIKAAVQGTLTTARNWTLSSGTDSVNVGNFPATQPVSLATNTPDVTDRTARLLGHVTVDSAPTTAVTGTFWQGTQPVSGTFWQGTQPVSAATLPLPTGAATDANISAALGSPTSDSPGSYTALDQFVRLRKLTDQQRQLMQQLVALQTPAPKPKTYTTLLHRS